LLLKRRWRLNSRLGAFRRETRLRGFIVSNAYLYGRDLSRLCGDAV